MLFYTVGQSRVFVAMLASGLLMGAWFDLTRRMIRLLEAGRVLKALIDLVFALVLCALLALALLFVNRLELRLYALLGAVSGAALYLCAVRPIWDAFARIVTKIGASFVKNHVISQIVKFFSK